MVLAQSTKGLDLVADLVEERFGAEAAAGLQRVDASTRAQQRQEAVQVRRSAVPGVAARVVVVLPAS